MTVYVIIMISISILAIPVSVIIYIRNKNRVNKIFQNLAAELDLVYKKGDIYNGPKISGRYNEFYISIQHSYGAKNKQPANNFLIRLNKQFHSFSITFENTFSKIKSAFGKNDILTYDNNFDNTFFIKCSKKSEMISLLNNKVRCTINKIFLNIRKKSFSFEIIEKGINVELTHHPDSIYYKLNCFIKLAGLLCRKGTVKEHLLENFYDEKEPSIQLNNLTSLFTSFSDFVEKEKILEDALNHPSAEINLLALENKKNIKLDEIDCIWKKADDRVKLELLELFLKIKNSVNQLIKYYSDADELEIKIKILNIMQIVGYKIVNKFLLDRIFSVEENQVKLAAIHALGTCGTIDEIEYLLSINHILLKKAAKESVLKIQSGLGPAERGSLSISKENSQEGALSINNDETGGLSINNEDPEAEE